MSFKKIDQQLKLFFHRVTEGFVQLIPRRVRANTLLLIRVDDIGDYVLFHNFIAEVRRSPKFCHYYITLCVNIHARDLVLAYDQQYVDHVIWIDRKLFKKNVLYKLWKLLILRLSGFSVAIESRYSREYAYGEKIIRAVQSPTAIAPDGDNGNITWEQKAITDRYYSEIIHCTKDIQFEFNWNREFFSALLEKPMDIKAPQFDPLAVSLAINIPKPYVVIFPGGSGDHKRWSHIHYARLADILYFEYGLTIVLAGSSGEKELCTLLKMYAYYRDHYIDVSGQTSLGEMVTLLAGAQLLIGNETCTVHMAVGVNTPVVCIANGNNFMRFTEYPQDSGAHVRYVYPPHISANLHDTNYLKEFYKHTTYGDINLIEYDAVKDVVDQEMERLGYAVKKKSRIVQ